ncbi:MAG TPA: Ni/Fe-hydrogenase, b-type cytochrome subunit [Anaerolineales bacterium]|nr:Ni/Fe-hydrogenase, b-type cytochrome subunit [Anaerolineae bacterium]HIQ01983.1 Ni/Fe-hydrogenase, b-type cytochrome subunit [Anaerolineales bacterium]
MHERAYVWELPVRVFHWVHVVSIAVLAITGYYIGNPFLVVPRDPVQTYVMGWVRYVHFISAFAFGLGFLVRVYWFFVGNPYSSWRDWIPASRERWGFFWKQLKYYVFLERGRPHYMGHNPVAGLSYAGLGLMILVQGITGFALYAEPYTGGFWRVGFGWLLTLFGNQTLRMTHHVLMWLFGLFFIVHLYMAVLADVEERDGAITGIISGVKFDRAS